MSKIPMNYVDLAWLRMDHATNPMIVTVVIKLNEKMTYDRLIMLIKESFTNYRRFRQRIVRPKNFFQRPYWEDDPDYRVEDHVECHVLPPPGDDLALEALVSNSMGTTLDFAHPLWKVTLVGNYPDGSVLILRMHHCIADGVSLMQVLLRMTRTSPDEPITQAAADEPKPNIRTPKLHPSSLFRNHSLRERLTAMLKIILLSPDTPSIFKGRLGMAKKAAWSEPFSLADVRRIALYQHATPNDVLMAIASGTIRRYFDLNNSRQKRRIRAFVMVNLRRRFYDEELGNKFGLVFLRLPLDKDQPRERLEVVKQGMDHLKASAEYAATYQLLDILGRTPAWIERLATMFLDTKGTVVATNVAGPARELYLAGTSIQSIIAWVPQAGRIGVGLSFISYNNQVRMGINADAGLLPDPHKFIEFFMKEFENFQTETDFSGYSN